MHDNLAVVLSMQGKYDDAIKHLARVLELNPKYPDGHKRIGEVLLAAGKASEAIAHFNSALQTSTNQSEVYAELGAAYMQLSKYELAIQNLTKAIELKPDGVEALNNMAWLLATVGDVSIQDANRAIEFAERACKLTGYKNPESLDTLAAAYAAAVRFDDAVTTAQQAVDAAKAGGKEDLSGKIQSRVKLYQVGQPYRQK